MRALQPTQAALLTIDVQHYFVEGSHDGPTVLERLNRLAHVCRTAGVLVVHVTTPFRPQGVDVEQAVSRHRNLTVEPDDLLYIKNHFGAFHDGGLEPLLRSRGIATVIIGGFRTNHCCTATAWEAIARQFAVFFLRDGTATKDMAGVPASVLQQATCASFDHLFGNVCTVEQVIARIQE